MKRPVTKESLLKQIDRAHKKIKKLEASAQEWLDEEKLYEGTPMLVERRAAAEKADGFFKKIKYQKERRLKKLGEKLAEIRTGLLFDPTLNTAPASSLEPSAPPPL
jgi:hypothetical protein